jgi:uncharacterized membrane protein YhiD involved in acid resistance
MSLPVLLLAAAFALGAVISVARLFKWRFGLRTLLIGMTAIALAAGLISAFDLWPK